MYSSNVFLCQPFFAPQPKNALQHLLGWSLLSTSCQGYTERPIKTPTCQFGFKFLVNPLWRAHCLSLKWFESACNCLSTTLFYLFLNFSYVFAYMARRKHACRDSPTLKRANGITINEDVTASRPKVVNMSTTGENGKGKGKAPTLMKLEVIFESLGMYSTHLTTSKSDYENQYPRATNFETRMMNY